MAKFDLSQYETVSDRLARFHKDHPTARVITDMEHYDEQRVVFRADLYKNYEDEKPTATGYAEETRNEGGMVNSTSHLENCETSAIGRALANAGYAPTDKRPSREEMAKVNRVNGTTAFTPEQSEKDKEFRRLYGNIRAAGKDPVVIVPKLEVKVGKTKYDWSLAEVSQLADKFKEFSEE